MLSRRNVFVFKVFRLDKEDNVRNVRMDFIVLMDIVLFVRLIQSLLMDDVSVRHLSKLIEVVIVYRSVNNWKYTIL